MNMKVNLLLMNIFIVLRQGGIQVLLIRPLEVWNQENL